MNRWAIFLSGKGSTSQALLNISEYLNIKLVVSSRKSAFGLKRANRMGVSTLVLNKEPDWNNLSAELKKRKINKIFLLGFMKILPEKFCQEWEGKVFNIHPSLLPDYAGKDAMLKSYQDKKSMGVSIHHVTSVMDAGDVIRQKAIENIEKDFELHKVWMSFLEQRLIREVGVRL